MALSIKNLSYDVWYDLDRMRDDIKEGVKFVGYKDNKIYEYLSECGFIKLEEDNTRDRYRWYKGTKKFLENKDAQILSEICDKPIDQIMKEKIISVDNIPDDIESLIEALNDADGYFDKVDLHDSEFGGCMKFHGFATGAGTNGYYYSGTEKLRNTITSKVIKTLTGLTMEDVVNAKRQAAIEKDIKLLKKLADQYGFIVMSKLDMETVYDD